MELKNQKWIIHLLLALSLCFSSPLFAEEEEYIEAVDISEAADFLPLPSLEEYSEGGWNFAIGVEVGYGPEFKGSDENDFEILPAFSLGYEQDQTEFYLEGIGEPAIGVRWTSDSNWMLGIGLMYEFGREEDDGDALEGMGDEDDAVLVVLESQLAFSEEWNWWIGGKVMIGDSDKGAAGELSIGRRIETAIEGMEFEIVGFATFGNDDFLQGEFGVDAEQAERSEYELYEVDSGFRSMGLSLGLEYEINERWLLAIEFGFEKFSDDIGDSPLVKAGSDSALELGMSLMYNF